MTTYVPFVKCISHPLTSACNATQKNQWLNYGQQFLKGLNAARLKVPPQFAKRNGGVITSCPIHTTLINDLAHRIKVQG